MLHIKGECRVISRWESFATALPEVFGGINMLELLDIAAGLTAAALLSVRAAPGTIS